MFERLFGRKPKAELTFDRIAKLDLKPGDIVVLEASRPLTAEQRKTLRDTWEQIAPGIKALCLDQGVHMKAITPRPNVS